MGDPENEVSRKGLKNLETAVRSSQEKHSASDSHGEVGILREEFSGKGFKKYVEQQFTSPEFRSDRVRTALNIASRANDGHLVNACNDAAGRQALLMLYKELVAHPGNKDAQRETGRILSAFGTYKAPADLQAGVEKEGWVFPAKFTILDPAHLKAEVTEAGDIKVTMYGDALKTYRDDLLRAGIPLRIFTEGVTLKPDQWVGFKLHDEGGITIKRPALYLLDLSVKSTEETWKNIMNVGSLALPGGPFMKMGGVFKKGAGLVIEKALEKTANALMLGNLAVRESRGWIIKTFPDKGKEFVEKFDLLSTIASFYGIGKMVATPALAKSVDKLGRMWKEMTSGKALNPEDMAKLAQVDKAVTQFTESAKQTSAKMERPTPAGPESRSGGRAADAEDGWQRLRERVDSRKTQDFRDGLKSYSPEYGMMMEVKNPKEARELYRKVLQDYPEREWALLHDPATEEHFIVHGEPKHGIGKDKTAGQVDLSAVREELKGRQLKVVDHYHNRVSASDHIAAFPSASDFRNIFDGKMNAKGDIVNLRCLDQRAKGQLRSYFTELPGDLSKMSEANRKFLERHLGAPLDTNRPYVVVFPDARTGQLVGRQFKQLDEVGRFAGAYSTVAEARRVSVKDVAKKPSEYSDVVRKQLKRELALKEKQKEHVKRPGEKPR